MNIIKTATLPSIIIIILFSIMVVASCTNGIVTATNGLQQTNSSETIVAKTEQSTTPAHVPLTTMAEKTTTTTTATTAQNTTMVQTITSPAASATTTKSSNVFIPVVGDELYNWIIPYDYVKWTVLQFDYDIYEQGSDYHFPWSLTVRNKTETDLDLTAYIIHWGYHNSIGHVSKMPFILKGGATKNLSGEDVLDKISYDEMGYLEDIQIEVYIIEE